MAACGCSPERHASVGPVPRAVPGYGVSTASHPGALVSQPIRTCLNVKSSQYFMEQNAEFIMILR